MHMYVMLYMQKEFKFTPLTWKLWHLTVNISRKKQAIYLIFSDPNISTTFGTRYIMHVDIIKDEQLLQSCGH